MGEGEIPLLKSSQLMQFIKVPRLDAYQNPVRLWRQIRPIGERAIAINVSYFL